MRPSTVALPVAASQKAPTPNRALAGRAVGRLRVGRRGPWRLGHEGAPLARHHPDAPRTGREAGEVGARSSSRAGSTPPLSSMQTGSPGHEVGAHRGARVARARRRARPTGRTDVGQRGQAGGLARLPHARRRRATRRGAARASRRPVVSGRLMLIVPAFTSVGGGQSLESWKVLFAVCGPADEHDAVDGAGPSAVRAAVAGAGLAARTDVRRRR